MNSRTPQVSLSIHVSMQTWKFATEVMPMFRERGDQWPYLRHRRQQSSELLRGLEARKKCKELAIDDE